MGNFGRRPNPVYSPEYRRLVGVIIEQRRAAGLSQRRLAERLGKSPSHITMIERGQRRVDTLELFLIAGALGVDPIEFFLSIATTLTQAASAPATE